MTPSGEPDQIVVSGQVVDIVRKNIKNLHLAVYPPHGRVRIAVPDRIDDELVRLAVVSRLGWIRRQQAAFAEQVRQSRREMVSGESHFVEGRRYLLDVREQEARPSVHLRNGTTLEIRVPPETSPEKREALLDRWHRQRLREQIPELIARWEPVLGVDVADWRLRKMKTRWGSCNVEARRIWINPELAKKPPECLEYIVVHEMVHLLERSHNERFKEYMDRFMPRWRTHRSTLNRMPLRHEDWTY